MLNPQIAVDVADILKLAVNGISLILLIRLVPATASTLIMALSRLFENQKE